MCMTVASQLSVGVSNVGEGGGGERKGNGRMAESYAFCSTNEPTIIRPTQPLEGVFRVVSGISYSL